MNKITIGLIALGSWLLFSGSASAQVGCPPGYYPIVQGPTGQTVQTCVPEAYTGRGDYEDSGDAPTAPPVRWADRWGAIATDAENAKLGVITDVQNKRLAERNALKDCKDNGGVNCKLQLSYYNQCAALVVGDKMMNTWRAESLEVVKELGLSDCQKDDSNCRVYYSACSLPERIQ